MLNDLMDINEWIKIKIVDWPDTSYSQYINGLVFTKNLTDKRMRQTIKDPKILLLKGTLGLSEQ